MFNEQEFVNDFLAAAKENNEDKMKDLAESISTQSVELRIDVLESIVKSLKESGDNDDVQKGLDGTLQLMKLALEAADHEDSTVEEAKDNTEAVEATQDVAADNSADEAEKTESSDSSTVAESGGYAPTEEEKAEKDEEK